MFLAIDNQSMSMGSAACNDLILLCTSVAGKSGQMIAQKAGCFLHMANGHRHRLGWKSYQLGLYRIYVAKLLPLLLVMIGLVILGCTFFLTSSSSVSAVSQQFALPARHTYGNLMDKQTYVHKLSYDFEIKKVETLTFLFTPGNIPNDDDLLLSINGQTIAPIKSCLHHWDRQQRVTLEAKYLQPGINILTFVYTGPLSHAWGVRNLYVQKSNPTQDRTANESFDIAQKLFVERKAKVGNLLRAQKMMQHLIKNHQGAPSTLQAYQLFMSKVEHALHALQQGYLRDARVLVRNAQLQKARRYYEKVLQELIDPMDPLRVEIQTEMRKAGIL
ncbi:MAG: hypothetical protein KDK51_08555 [Deltaproteobacteria bacterium]|nr:hypothetical protein [Deltaproteobacteria bacterium]